ncbi:LuxR family transcriptional regulator [Streptomyces sp. NPDC002039]|uniref:LuxR family transcriptional regulator n=1 Tax=unclassified Streptomyces TaxID=2593676 RepID=UPI00333150C8
MKQDHFGTVGCDCDESPPNPQPCKAALTAYRTALREGRAPREGLPPCLWRLHLVMEDREDPGYAVPVTPAAATFATLGPLEDLLTERRRSVRAAKARLSVFEAVYAQEQDAARPAPVRLVGQDVISATLEAAVGSCREELRTVQPGGGRPEGALSEALERDLRALERGVRQRTLYQHTVQTHRPTMWYIEQVTAAGAEVRSQAEIIERVIICDQDVAFIQLSDEPAEGALHIGDPSLVRFLTRYFDQTWERSTPILPTGSASRGPIVTSDLQRTILRAVIGGETDSSIARRLGMSRRSVAEHIRKVSLALGSGSRAQLGYLLAASGLLDDEA